MKRHLTIRSALRGTVALACLAWLGVSAWAGPPAVRGAEPATAPADNVASLDVLREKLAEKLGATPAPGSSHVLRVSTRAHGGEFVVTPKPGAPVRPAARPARAAGAEPGTAGPHGAPPTAGAQAGHGAGGAAHWSYDGPTGPQAWASLKPEFAPCASGTRQSPIDIRGGIGVDLEPVQFHYRPSGFSVVDNGHTVQVDLGVGNSIEAMGRRYDLVQFHFHRPSEERIDGRQFDMVAHLVHRDPDGRLAVVAVLLDRGSAHPIVQTVWNHLPLEKGEPYAPRATIDPDALLPQDRHYYTYMGSLTTPPCSEGVLWMVMRQPVTISPEQIDIFARLYPMNARPLQAANGRLIKGPN
jgi:carbonic anhydrase